MTITLRSSRRETPHDLACSPLAVVLMIEIRNLEDVDGLKRASLSALRPQLVGAIAEDADRVLAEEKEDFVMADAKRPCASTFMSVDRAL